MRCPGCDGAGSWESECCDGSGGCSCQGRRVPMGRCNVCGGGGEVVEGEHDPMANVTAITGYGFLGTGPTRSGLFDNTPRMGLRW